MDVRSAHDVALITCGMMVEGNRAQTVAGVPVQKARILNRCSGKGLTGEAVFGKTRKRESKVEE